MGFPHDQSLTTASTTRLQAHGLSAGIHTWEILETGEYTEIRRKEDSTLGVMGLGGLHTERGKLEQQEKDRMSRPWGGYLADPGGWSA